VSDRRLIGERGAGPVSGDTRGPLIPRFAIRRLVTDVEIASSFTTPIVIIPAVRGHTIVPDYAHLHRPVGTEWTAGAFARFELRIGAINVAFTSFNTNILTAASSVPLFMWLDRSSNSFALLSDVSSGNFEQAVSLYGVTGNPSGGSGGLEVTVFYRLAPQRLDVIPFNTLVVSN